MTPRYIVPAGAREKLKYAVSQKKAVYIFGMTCYGKTELVKRFLERQNYTYLSCALPGGEPDYNDAAAKDVVVIDDLQFAKSNRVFELIERIIDDGRRQLFVLGRAPVPKELAYPCMRGQMLVVSQEEIGVTAADAQNYCQRHRIAIEEADLQTLVRRAQGVPMLILYVLSRMESGDPDFEKHCAEAKQMFTRVVTQKITEQWEPEIVDFLTEMSVVPSFNVPLAEQITGREDAARIIGEMERLGNFSIRRDGDFVIHPFFREVLHTLLRSRYSEGEIRALEKRAADYYDKNDQTVAALDIYSRTDDTARIREMLIENARRNPGLGHYFEMRDAYFALPEAEIAASPTLMCGISILYSLLQPEKSEYWYDRLGEFAKQAKDEEKRQAAAYRAYLNIALPHRSVSDILRIFKSVPAAVLEKKQAVPKLGVTSNLPSLMNGGKDFCSWAKRDSELAALLGKVVEKAVSPGIVELALGESLYEKGGDLYAVIGRLSKGQLEADGAGDEELVFAAVGLLVRANAALGELAAAKKLADDYRSSIRRKGRKNLYPNVDALLCRLALLRGDTKARDAWMETAPGDTDDFNVMERYRYLTKIRVYIETRQYTAAFSLLQKLTYYAELYDRTYIKIETGLLLAVIESRTGRDWYGTLLTALSIAADHGFIRVVSDEGAAVLGLLRQARPKLLNEKALPKKWLAKLMEETERTAEYYPAYLNEGRLTKADFGKNALAVLRMQAKGVSNDQIAEALGVSVDNVKYHTKQNYKKLGVSTKTEMVLAAKELKLL